MSTKREEIIGHALRLIKHRSFSSFSYEDISKELKMTKAAVHYHFGKKTVWVWRSVMCCKQD